MPYVGPYVIDELTGLHTAKIRLEMDEASDPILVNVDQLSRCYPEFNPQTVLDFSCVKSKRRANRKRAGEPLKSTNIAPFHHLTTLRNVSSLGFVGRPSIQSLCRNINSSSRPVLECMIKNLHVKVCTFSNPGDHYLSEMSQPPPDQPGSSQDLQASMPGILTPTEMNAVLVRATKEKMESMQQQQLQQQAQGGLPPAAIPLVPYYQPQQSAVGGLAYSREVSQIPAGQQGGYWSFPPHDALYQQHSQTQGVGMAPAQATQYQALYQPAGVQGPAYYQSQMV
ncbi:MAG: hypothetical protein GY821_15800, partial [Gammaproteobacteria bacterium]|nr:hypothetical protein [Gammaproteobacteria bacterium]